MNLLKPHYAHEVDLLQSGCSGVVPACMVNSLAGMSKSSSALSIFGCARLYAFEHDVDVGDEKPIKQRFYRVNPEKRRYLDAEVTYN